MPQRFQKPEIMHKQEKCLTASCNRALAEKSIQSSAHELPRFQKKTTQLWSLFLSRQYFSAFLAAGCQYLAAILRAHTLAKAMHLAALANVRIERWFHLLHLLEDFQKYLSILNHF
jgi:hypothetical protein